MKTVQQTTRFIARLKRAGYKPRSYSGRGMFGKECVGVSLDRGQALTVGAKKATTDSLGMGTIAYWRGHAWPEGRVEEDEDEGETDRGCDW